MVQEMRKITIFHNSLIARWFLPKNYVAIMLFGMVFTRYSKLDDVCINHEWYHTRQYKDLFSACLILTILATTIAGICDLYPIWWAVGGLFLSAVAYYIWYGIEYLINFKRLKNHSKAYRAIKFEQQAYAMEDDFLSEYKHFSWLKF